MNKITAIVKVNISWYRPNYVTVRADVGAYIFTCNVPLDKVEVLQHDEKVESVNFSEPLPLQKPV